MTGRGRGNGQIIQVSICFVDENEKFLDKGRKIIRNIIGKVKVGQYLLIKDQNKEDRLIKRKK